MLVSCLFRHLSTVLLGVLHNADPISNYKLVLVLMYNYHKYCLLFICTRKVLTEIIVTAYCLDVNHFKPARGTNYTLHLSLHRITQENHVTNQKPLVVRTAPI